MAFGNFLKGLGKGGGKGGAKDAGSGDDANASSGADAVQRDPRKARRFFEHAQTVSDARNYDYAVECYINGLKHDPDNINKHEELYEVAKRRKVSGGKPPGFGERLKGGGSDPIDKMLHAEKLWAKEPLSNDFMLDVMKYAVEADKQHDDLNLAEVAYWVGGLLLAGLQGKPEKKKYITARDLFVEIGAYDRAVDACRRALALDSSNSDLMQELKNLEAENMMQKGGYTGDKGQAGDFRRSIRDAEKQRALEQEDMISKTDTAAEEIIKRRRTEFDEDPQDLDKLVKLVDALLAREKPETEKEAIDLLRQAWEETGQYRYKVRIGDIQMKHLGRQIRHLSTELKANPEDTELKSRLQDARRKQLEFELKEFEDRVKNYPTDMGLRFELGKRLYASGKVDDAIGAFQQAKADPKQRSASHMYLGSCYLQKGWHDEAIETLQEGIQNHPIDDDRMALDMRYLLMDALYQSAARSKDVEKARESQKIASKILQTNINYRDIRQWIEKVKKLVDELGK